MCGFVAMLLCFYYGLCLFGNLTLIEKLEKDLGRAVIG